jgi:aminoglycoside N3'-acetyltransferase
MDSRTHCEDKIKSRTKFKIIKNRIESRVKRNIPNISSSKIGCIEEEKIDNILSNFNEKAVFVYIGLSDIKSGFNRDPYSFIFDKLSDNFQYIITPGFTPSFRESGVFHKTFSVPRYGNFSKLFFEDADYRTEDPIHSILVKGGIQFEECDHRDSFGSNSCWDVFDEENILNLNIGTDKFKTTQLYYIERRYNLPYVTVPEHSGVIYSDPNSYKHVTQLNHGYDMNIASPAPPNWKKLKLYLERSGSLQDLSTKGLTIYSFCSQDIRKDLERRLRTDPYYLRS